MARSNVGKDMIQGAKEALQHKRSMQLDPLADMAVIEPLHGDVVLPSRATDQSAGYDLRAYLKDQVVTLYTPHNAETVKTCMGELILSPGWRALIPTGFKARIPKGTVALIYARSSTAMKQGLQLPNGVGVIDADYPEQWLVPVINVGQSNVVIKHGDRLAQAVMQRWDTVSWVVGEVRPTTDRAGGLGSTGK